MKEHYDIAVILASGIISRLETYKDIYSKDLINYIYKYNLLIQICDKELFAWILESIMDGNFDKNSVNKKLKSKYNKFIQSI